MTVIRRARQMATVFRATTGRVNCSGRMGCASRNSTGSAAMQGHGNLDQSQLRSEKATREKPDTSLAKLARLRWPNVM